MGKSFSLKNLSTYISDNINEIGAVRKEVEEIQVGFNSAYVEWKAEHDATLERLTETVADQVESIGPELQALVQERIVEEKRIIEARRLELRDELIPATQAEADRVLSEGQRLTKKMRLLNPSLDQREEKLKAQRASLEKDLAQLNKRIRELSGCLGLVINFLKITKLDRQRQRVIGKLETVQEELRDVREEWKTREQQMRGEQEALQTKWQETTIKLAQLNAELDYLDDESSREDLARKRAVRYTFDNLKEPIACPLEEVKQELDHMVQLNVEADAYEEGLGSVGSLMSVLDGITEGLKRFGESVEGLLEEQRMHSSYLPNLNISVPGGVLAFHEQWGDLRRKVHDDGHLCAHPAEFVDMVGPILEDGLNTDSIQLMFDGLGGALRHATKGWRG
jgi:chromosome segregation ATPase